MINKVSKALGRKKYLAVAIPLLMAAQAQGVEFNIGQIEGSFGSQLSLGSSWRVQGAEESLLTNTDGEASNSDDGNKNYASGDAFSQIFKGSHDLQFSYQNFGGFVRGKYWYDSAIENNSVDYGHGPTTDVGGQSGTALSYNEGEKLDDSEFNDLSKASGAELMDAYVYGEFDVLDMPLDVRLGKQVVSWGESTFITGGVNSINPIDVNSYRRPGAEIKEVLLPVNMAYANLGLTENLSMETFYQLEFQEHVIPGCGTFFSNNDYASEGCNNISIKDGVTSIERDADGKRDASDEGQYGMAFRFISEALGDTEFGLYSMNIHSRVPSVNFVKNDVSSAAVLSNLSTQYIAGYTATGIATLAANGIEEGHPAYATQLAGIEAQASATAGAYVTANGAAAIGAAVVDDSGYYVTYKEDIQVTGLSFSSTVGSVALSGEISHKQDVPVQINGPQMITALLGANLADDGVAANQMDAAQQSGDADAIAAAGAAQLAATQNNNSLDLELAAVEGGSEVDGYRLFDVSQVQVTAIQFFDQVAGASRITVVGEVGMSYVHSFDEGDDAIKYGRSDIFGAPSATSTDGFVTTSSWGYRARVMADYTDVFAGVNLTPVLSWSHDVEGYAPNSSGAFKEEQQSLGLSLEANYREMYSAAISYNQFMGGDYSTVSDHDFASISMGVQF